MIMISGPKRLYYINMLREVQFPSPSSVFMHNSSSEDINEFIVQSRSTVINILNGKDPRLLLILGPCSIHDLDSAREYAMNLKSLSTTVSDSIFIVMRTYFEKSRTKLGWKGFLRDPYLDGTEKSQEGLTLTRKLLVELAEMGLPTATEFVDPFLAPYFSDLISWGSIGARLVSSPVHRQMASGLPMPMGFKNNTDGNIAVAVHAAVTAQASHSILSLNSDGKILQRRTTGNPCPHIVLRGGQMTSNYDTYSLKVAANILGEENLSTRLIVDCSHDNSRGDEQRQIDIFKTVFQQKNNVAGLMLESNIFPGNQSISSEKLRPGLSVTDPCIDWKATEELLLWALQSTESPKLEVSS